MRAGVLGTAAALGVVAAGLLSAPASAASVSGCYGSCMPGVVRSDGIFRYDALLNVNDQITITADGTTITLVNPASTLTAGTNCTSISVHEVRCAYPTSLDGRIRSLNGNDTITNSSPIGMQLNGGDGADTITGGAGDDDLIGGSGADVLRGGGGSDTVTYNDPRSNGVTVDLDAAVGDDGGPEDGPAGARDTVGTDVENIAGTQWPDVLTGNDGANVIDGGSRSSATGDLIKGLGGNDTLSARGAGTLDGGAGTDHCTTGIYSQDVVPDKFVSCETTEIIP